ncbi:hypothetical protein POX_c03947 [Penicillium oxalicum]|nr:hypothetical protein POX_c03947 [Penicillium oxalicum]KAI2791092.1 hypothetical protein POX_c03947 [Penicillium oxalicum]
MKIKKKGTAPLDVLGYIAESGLLWISSTTKSAAPVPIVGIACNNITECARGKHMTDQSRSKWSLKSGSESLHESTSLRIQYPSAHLEWADKCETQRHPRSADPSIRLSTVGTAAGPRVHHPFSPSPAFSGQAITETVVLVWASAEMSWVERGGE